MSDTCFSASVKELVAQTIPINYILDSFRVKGENSVIYAVSNLNNSDQFMYKKF